MLPYDDGKGWLDIQHPPHGLPGCALKLQIRGDVVMQ